MNAPAAGSCTIAAIAVRVAGAHATETMKKPLRTDMRPNNVATHNHPATTEIPANTGTREREDSRSAIPTPKPKSRWVASHIPPSADSDGVSEGW